jgi:hypothetical protein
MNSHEHIITHAAHTRTHLFSYQCNGHCSIVTYSVGREHQRLQLIFLHQIRSQRLCPLDADGVAINNATEYHNQKEP